MKPVEPIEHIETFCGHLANGALSKFYLFQRFIGNKRPIAENDAITCVSVSITQ